MIEKYFMTTELGSFGNHIVGHLFTIIYFFLTLAFVSLIIRSKKPPGSTLAWLMFTILIPYLGIPLYVFLSDRKFKTRLEKKQDLELAASPPVRSNLNVALVTSGEEAYQRIVAMIESAVSSINITTFIFANDSVGQKILEAMSKKAEQGVKVRVLLDSLGAMWVRHPSFSNLQKKGGEVAHFMPFFHLPFQGRSNLRNHRKILVVDSVKATIGGMNIAEEYMGPNFDSKRWTDLCLFVEGPSARDVENIFAKDWKFSTAKSVPACEVHHDARSTTEVGAFGHSLQIIASGPDVKDDPLYDSFLSFIYKANFRVWIATPYFIPDESLAKALELAAKRGVKVRILTPERSNHFLADLARGSYLRQLQEVGAEVFLTPKMMHAKAILVDDEYCLVGSANFDMRSLLFNYEIGAFLKSSPTIKDLHTWFARIFLESKIGKFQKGFWIDMAEGVGRVLGPLI